MTEEAFSKSSPIGSKNLQNINDVQNTRNTTKHKKYDRLVNESLSLNHKKR